MGVVRAGGRQCYCVTRLSDLPATVVALPPPVLSTKSPQSLRKVDTTFQIFCSTSHSINVQKIFKIVLAKAFDLKCVIPEIDQVGEPILLYNDL